MKFAAVIFFGLVAVCLAGDPIELNAEQKEKAHTAAVACIAQEQVDKEAVQKLRTGDFGSVDQKSKCFANCYLEKLGLIANGEPQESVIKTKLGAIVGDEAITRVIGECNSLRGADKCDTAFKLYECYYKNRAVYVQ